MKNLTWNPETLACRALMLALVLVSAAGTAGSAAAEATTPVAHRVVETGGDGVWASPAALLATSAEDWNMQMRDLYLDGALLGSVLPAAPDVDWSRSSVVLVTLGYLPNDDQQLLVTAVGTSASLVQLDITVLRETGTGQPSSVYAILEVEATGMRGVTTDYSYAGSGEPASGTPANLSWGALKAQYR